jgi:hypothetical protein
MIVNKWINNFIKWNFGCIDIQFIIIEYIGVNLNSLVHLC